MRRARATTDIRQSAITYKTDVAGQVVHRKEADNNTSLQEPQGVWYRFGGKQIGDNGNNGTSDKDYMASVAD